MSTSSLPWTPFLLAVVPALIAGAIEKNGVPYKRAIAAILYAMLVWGMAEWNSSVGTAFAWVGAIASLLINGQTLFKAVEGIL